MLAYRDGTGDWRMWQPGTALPDGRSPAPNAEALLSDEELADLGLRRVVQCAVPIGKIALSWSLVDQAGVPLRAPTLADAPADAPSVITPFQMRAILRRAGCFEAVRDLVYASHNADLIDTWEYGIEVRRDSLGVEFIRQQMGWDPAYVDQLFTNAAGIQA